MMKSFKTFAEMSKNVDQDLKTLFQVDMPERYRPLERFVCRVYSATSNVDTLPELRWELFRHKNLEGEKFPPTRGTLSSPTHSPRQLHVNEGQITGNGKTCSSGA